MWLFLTVPLFPSAKEAVWEDKGFSAADPGFCERVEGKFPSHTWLLLGCASYCEKELLEQETHAPARAYRAVDVFPGGWCVGLGVFLPLTGGDFTSFFLL